MDRTTTSEWIERQRERVCLDLDHFISRLEMLQQSGKPSDKYRSWMEQRILDLEKEIMLLDLYQLNAEKKLSIEIDIRDFILLRSGLQDMMFSLEASLEVGSLTDFHDLLLEDNISCIVELMYRLNRLFHKEGSQ